MSDLNNVLARGKALGTGDFKGAFRSKQTVSIEEHPEHPKKYVLRFGEGKDDYLSVAGDALDREALREIVSKVIESPTQLKKIKDMPLEKRPELAIERGMTDANGYSDGRRIVIAGARGTGYGAAATFVHELQHHNQEIHDGINHYKGNLSLAEDILDDRLFESAAETAAYQYLYEMKDANPQAMNVYRNTTKDSRTWYAQGMRDYAAAKEAGKSEAECVLAGMRGYATNYHLALSYETGYHRDAEAGISPNLQDYADYLHEGIKSRAVEKINRGLGGDHLDEVAAFKSHTVGMMDTLPTDEQIKGTVRDREYAFVTTRTAKVLNEYVSQYQKLTGEQHPKSGKSFAVRDREGIRDSTEPEKNGKVRTGLREKLRTSMNKVDKVIGKIYRTIRDIDKPKHRKTGVTTSVSSKRVVPAVIDIYDKENILLSLDGKRKDLKSFSGALYYKPDLAFKEFGKIPGGDRELYSREYLLNKVLSDVMKDEKLRSDLMKHGSENPLVVGFGKNPDVKTNKPTIVLDPRKSAEELAKDFRKQFEALKEKGSRTVEQKRETVKPKESEKASRASVQTKQKTSEGKKSFFKGLKETYQKRENAAKAAQAARVAASRRGGR